MYSEDDSRIARMLSQERDHASSTLFLFMSRKPCSRYFLARARPAVDIRLFFEIFSKLMLCRHLESPFPVADKMGGNQVQPFTNSRRRKSLRVFVFFCVENQIE